LTIDQV